MELLVLNKKKSFVDFISIFFALVIIFGVAIFTLILYNAYNDNVKDNLATALTSSTPEDANANVTKILGQTSSGISKLNPLFPLLIVGVLGYIIVLVFMARSHPSLFFIGLIVLGVALTIAATFSNVYESVGSNENFSGSAEDLGVIDFVMSKLPTFIFVFFIVISIILYALRQGPPSGGAY